MKIKIEPVKNTEAKLLSDISAACFYDTFHEQNSQENMMLFLKESFTADILAKEMLQASNYFFFAKSGNKIAGYIKLSASEAPGEIEENQALEIARIYVVKEIIGQKIGKSLIEFAFSFALQLQKKIIWLGVWEHNNRAITFYQNYGFEKFGEHVFMLGNDAQTDWLMKKEL